ncbi:MAG: tetratricopeptide repeat protein [Fusobacterium gastrosuis]|uniref:tetratricopeptide repeat protein n=1 Tax=Fusobacterium gastrosuis TaxID=1755100 RepID=UPI002A867E9F|nr:tetratricopeptide repeat protein [Fusobacterium gastrosuis]
MKKSLLKQLDKWHEENEHEKIITEILNLDEEDKTPEIIGKLARAYNNIDEYEKGIEVGKTIEETEGNTAVWNYRMGYSYFYMEGKEKKAEKHFKKAFKLNPNEPDVPFFLRYIYQVFCIDAVEKENDCKKAIKWALKALKFAELEENKEEIIWCFSRLGWLYDSISEYKKALPFIEKAINLGREDIGIYSEYTYSLSRNFKYNEAIKAANKAIELGRDDEWIYNELGYAYSNLENYEKTLEFYTKAKERAKEENLVVEIEIGRALAELGRYEEALENFKKLNRKKNIAIEDKKTIISQLSYTYRRAADYKNALKFALKANELGKDDAWLNVEIGLNYLYLDKYEEALKYFEKAHSMDNEYSTATLQVANCYKLLGRYEEALVYLLKLYENESNDIWLNSEIGWIYDELANYEEAYKYLEKAENLGRNDDWIFSEIGQCLARLGRYEEALVKLKIVLDMPGVATSEQIFVNSEIGWVYDRLENREEALKYLFKANELGRDDIWLNSEIAWSLVDFPDRYEEAEKHFLKAIELGRNDAWIYNQIAFLYEKMKKFDKALAYLKKADEILPYDNWTHYHLGICYREVGKFNKAIEILNKSYEHTKYQGWVDLQLAWCYALIDNKEKAYEYLANVDKFLSAELDRDELLKADYETIKSILSSFSYLS